MTTPDSTGLVDFVVPGAERAGLAAADAAGVEIRELRELSELEAVYRLYDSIWRPDPKNPPVTTELLRALTKAGNYVSGAYDGEELVGACVGFFAAPAEVAMHSHVAGVSEIARGRNVGFALKLHQRAWALQRGVTAISWTFDPLIRRNAYFNLTKLAAQPTEYLTNFYGFMADGINNGDDTDRLLIRWELDTPTVAAAADRHPPIVSADKLPEATIALARATDGRPTTLRHSGALLAGPHGPPAAAKPAQGGHPPGAVAKPAASGRAPSGSLASVAWSPGGETVLVAVPADVEALRRTDPKAAKEWRVALREVLGGLLADGAQVTGFDRAGWYVVEHPVKGLV